MTLEEITGIAQQRLPLRWRMRVYDDHDAICVTLMSPAYHGKRKATRAVAFSKRNLDQMLYPQAVIESQLDEAIDHMRAFETN